LDCIFGDGDDVVGVRCTTVVEREVPKRGSLPAHLYQPVDGRFDRLNALTPAVGCHVLQIPPDDATDVPEVVPEDAVENRRLLEGLL